MKTIASIVVPGGLCLLGMLPVTASESDPRIIMVPQPAPKEEALIFSAKALGALHVGETNTEATVTVDFTILQGIPRQLSLSLTGKGPVTEVNADRLQDWAIRVDAAGKRFLDLRPKLDEKNPLKSWKVTIHTSSKVENRNCLITLPWQGEAAGWGSSLRVEKDPNLRTEPHEIRGMTWVKENGADSLVSKPEDGSPMLMLDVTPSGFGSAGMELRETALKGAWAADGKSVSFLLSGKMHAREAGATIRLLGKEAALSSGQSGEGWHVSLSEMKGGMAYQLVADRAGDFPLRVGFVVPVEQRTDGAEAHFNLPAGNVMPLTLSGLPEGVEFGHGTVIPQWLNGQWSGALPADGKASLLLRQVLSGERKSLFFTSSERVDVLVDSGQLKQLSRLEFRTLQGKIEQILLNIRGPGEVLAVKGDGVLDWEIHEKDGQRQISVRLSHPLEGEGHLEVESQQALGGFPLKAETLRLSPEGSLQHSGWIRLGSDGAVKLAMTHLYGLLQMSPDQYPGGTSSIPEGVQVFRFPTADYRFGIEASQILPEYGVMETTVYELTETERRIQSELELDIREAPLREWEIGIPADYAVAGVKGSDVVDYSVAADAEGAIRRLKLIFKGPLRGRHLCQIQLEKNEPPQAGEWGLPELGFPGAKSHRGFLGLVAGAGYRLSSKAADGVGEVPTSFFPRQIDGLQQAYRLKEDRWSARVGIEALGQNVQADLFHLYSLREGAVSGSVLVNYFVVGAPATEWKLAVPEGIVNLNVTGQNVGRDWRKEGNTVVVPLTKPISGAATLLVSFEQPMSARGGDIRLGEVHPLEVQGERGFVQLVSPTQVRQEVMSSKGSLLAVDASELPAEFRLLNSAPTLGAWQYTARDFEIRSKIEWPEPGETTEQVVDFLNLTSDVTRDGQWVSTANFFVKTRGRTTMALELPTGCALWDAKVDGKAVNARQDDRKILLPLPPRKSPAEVVEITLRYGSKSDSKRRVNLAAPLFGATVITGEWQIQGEDGQCLLPTGGNAIPNGHELPESGWQWLGRQPLGISLLVLCGLVAVWLRKAEGTRKWIGLLVRGLGLSISVGLMLAASTQRLIFPKLLDFNLPIIAANEAIRVELLNLTPAMAQFGIMSTVFLMLGCLALIPVKLRRWGFALIGAGLLGRYHGAVPFLGMMAGFWLVDLVKPLLQLLPRRPEVVAAVLLLVSLGMLCEHANAEPERNLRVIDSMKQQWEIHEQRLRGEMELSTYGESGARYLLLREPAMLKSFQGDGLRLEKAPYQNEVAYFLIAEKSGALHGTAEFEMALATPANGWVLPNGPSGLQEIQVQWDEPDWEFMTTATAKSEAIPGLPPTSSGAILTLKPVDGLRVTPTPRQKAVESETTKFFSELAHLYVPSPGMISGYHRLSIRPTQGLVRGLRVRVPEGLTISNVVGDGVGQWSFDPTQHELKISLNQPRQDAFQVEVESQMSMGALPSEVELKPLAVMEAADELGMMAVAFPNDTQADSLTATGMTAVNQGDFDSSIVGRAAHQQRLTLQNVYRYREAGACLKLKVAAVAPELRSEIGQIVSLGEDRMTIAADLVATISRSGLFQMELDVPEGLEIESVSGAALSQWTETRDAQGRRLLLHLTGKTLGVARFHLTLSGAATGSQQNWHVPHLSLRGASRETGKLGLVPDRGLQIRATERFHVSQIDPDSEGFDGQTALKSPGALAYRLLQADWRVSLAISQLDPWVTAQLMQEVTVREGQSLSRVQLRYHIENAAVKALRVKLPGLDAAAAATVRANGPAVTDFVAVSGEDHLWEIRFQRGIAGDTPVEIEFQQLHQNAEETEIQPVELIGVRQMTHHVALHQAGRLELEPGVLPRGWQKVDASSVEANPASPVATGAPQVCYRLADPEGALMVRLKRHHLADLEKIRVVEGILTTLISPADLALTAVDLKVQVRDRGTLRLQLPGGSELFQVQVNEEGVSLVRDGDAWLFRVSAEASSTGQAVSVRFVYSSSTRKGTSIKGPNLGLPMENLRWEVYVPEGYELKAKRGDFEQTGQTKLMSYGMEDYLSASSDKRSTDTSQANNLLSQASSWLKNGEAWKASQALSRAVHSNRLDQASDEDARIQLLELKTQQAMLGLNTRRQKIALDHHHDGPSGALEEAARANPLIQGEAELKPEQIQNILQSNSSEENSALGGIANQLASQQLATDPAPSSLEVNVPASGKGLIFSRKLQIDASRPMSIEMELTPQRRRAGWLLAVPLVFLPVLLLRSKKVC